ncbi:sigma-70 family RNA polymerase sigma factor [Mucilaginibacter aquaedulcis]|uniref:sigma-70 family RNA polymerase sigma factor n=1 Tax=Mucilaginibacter aquaedulcis TaxID=1187081 RepID=UPI0025B5BD15|nr:sigma-70 family RNA polymerase sigma factor [Mucilaginibacter aquaedulcis]MDN3546759.1 sigma-70 family RNA polymerase sigma factor [Mucilaginibacter aquaedulcis]
MNSASTGKELLAPEKWVELHADYLYKYAMTRINDEDAARDLVQETFLAALEKKEKFRGDSTERTWLTAIIKYKVIDVYRTKANAFTSKDEYGTPPDEAEFFDPDLNNWKKEHWPAPFADNVHDPLHNKEFMSVLQKCLNKLPPLWMSVFKLKHMDDEKTDSICEDLRISTSNFWVIIHRAKVNLRSCLQKNWN